MYRCTTAAALSAFILLTSTSVALSQDDWQLHQNARYGFSFTYPRSLFVLEKTSEAGDGHFFRARHHDARLIAGVIVNHGEHTPTSYYKYVASRSYGAYETKYRKIGPSWFAISGKKDGRIFYEKVQFSCHSNLISSFALIYPSRSERVINPVIERMEDSFRSARNCTNASAHSPSAGTVK